MPKPSWSERTRSSTKTLSLREKVVTTLWQQKLFVESLTSEQRMEGTEMLRCFLASAKPLSDPRSFEEYQQWVDMTFQQALENKDFQLFACLFEPLEKIDLERINCGEGLGINISETQVPPINEYSTKALQQYLDDKNFSAVVSIHSQGNVYHIASNGNDTATPFAIHSVGKIFTGVLLLRLIQEKYLPEDLLNRPVQLPHEVTDKLSVAQQQRLKEVTLKDLMTHRSGLGDYMQGYHNALNAGQGQITACQDFLNYRDDALNPAGDHNYSNLGILLVGIAIEHGYFLKTGEKKSFEELLREFTPLENFSVRCPNNGQYNSDDPIQAHVAGSPAGGYWMSVEELQMFGVWLNKTCQTDAEFCRLVAAHGGEFYNPARNRIAHQGDVKSASAYLLTSLDNDTTIAILSDQPMVAARLQGIIIDQSHQDNLAHATVNVAQTTQVASENLEHGDSVSLTSTIKQ